MSMVDEEAIEHHSLVAKGFDHSEDGLNAVRQHGVGEYLHSLNPFRSPCC